MIENRHITKLVAFITALAVLLCAGAMFHAEELVAFSGGPGVTMAYETALFDTDEIIELHILMDESQWQDMLDTAGSEEYYPCDLVVNGQTYHNVGIRPKGNSSLLMVSRGEGLRFSFRIKFDEYVGGQTCQGLDTLILNNSFNDASQLREAITYDMFAYLDAPASLYNYTRVSVNGEYYGVYLALEGVDESFAMRNYGADFGELYKPDNAGGGGRAAAPGNDAEDESVNVLDAIAGLFTSDDQADAAPTGAPAADSERGDPFGDSSGDSAGNAADDSSGGSAGNAAGGNDQERPAAPDNGGEQAAGGNTRPARDDAEGFGNSFGGQAGGQGGMPNAPDAGNDGDDGFGASPGGQGGASSESLAMALNYVDDDLATYDSIWVASQFDTSDADHRRVVDALKIIDSGENLESAMDVDKVLCYMAVQTFVRNTDGLTGSVTHNYYLYEEDGRLHLVPWDYNESFGSTSDPSELVNFPIDTPFTISDLSQRRFFMVLIENDEYRARYHEYLRILAEDYVRGGELEKVYNRIRSQIDDLSRTDPTAFNTYAEYDAAATALYEIIGLRADSVSGQVAGTIPSTKEGQSAAPEKLLDTTGVNTSGLSRTPGGGGGDFGDSFGGRSSDAQTEQPDAQSTEMPSPPADGTTPDGFGDSAGSSGAPQGTADAPTTAPARATAAATATPTPDAPALTTEGLVRQESGAEEASPAFRIEWTAETYFGALCALLLAGILLALIWRDNPDRC